MSMSTKCGFYAAAVGAETPVPTREWMARFWREVGEAIFDDVDRAKELLDLLAQEARECTLQAARNFTGEQGTETADGTLFPGLNGYLLFRDVADDLFVLQTGRPMDDAMIAADIRRSEKGGGA